jgi:hypothetical protein
MKFRIVEVVLCQSYLFINCVAYDRYYDRDIDSHTYY